jgi:hypothetical protein
VQLLLNNHEHPVSCASHAGLQMLLGWLLSAATSMPDPFGRLCCKRSPVLKRIQWGMGRFCAGKAAATRLGRSVLLTRSCLQQGREMYM